MFLGRLSQNNNLVFFISLLSTDGVASAQSQSQTAAKWYMTAFSLIELLRKLKLWYYLKLNVLLKSFIKTVVCILHDAENWVRFIGHVTWKCCHSKVCGKFAAGIWWAFGRFPTSLWHVQAALSIGQTHGMRA